MKVLLFAGSLRKDSFNKKLVACAKNLLSQDTSLELNYVDIQSLQIPLYDGDIESSAGVPKGAAQLANEVATSNAIIVASPEYNGSISGVMKNNLDWISRVKPNPIAGKPVLILSASPGALGGLRGLWHTRVPFEALGSHVYPEMFGLAKAHQAFDSSGALVDMANSDKLNQLLKNFIQFSKKIS
jgi:chromate reductase, NAD(P)H dehydrogenase (quinone)